MSVLRCAAVEACWSGTQSVIRFHSALHNTRAHAPHQPEARSGLGPGDAQTCPSRRPRPASAGSRRRPGVIVLGTAIGSGEFLLGPAVFVPLRAVAALGGPVLATVLQTIFKTEVMRYTVATGEPVFTRLHATRPSSNRCGRGFTSRSTSCNSAGLPLPQPQRAPFFLFQGQLPAAERQLDDILHRRRHVPRLRRGAVSFGGEFERTLEILNWVLVVASCPS